VFSVISVAKKGVERFMKIEKVEVFGVAMPMIGEYKNAYLSKSVQKSAIVRITAGGVAGLEDQRHRSTPVSRRASLR